MIFTVISISELSKADSGERFLTVWETEETLEFVYIWILSNSISEE